MTSEKTISGAFIKMGLVIPRDAEVVLLLSYGMAMICQHFWIELLSGGFFTDEVFVRE